MLPELLPDRAAAVEVFADPPGIELYPEEWASVAHAVAARRSEFAAGRYCARAALARLGLPPAPVTKGDRGAPRWPDGVIGSITHCLGYRAAAVARAADMAVLGIDAEPNEPLPAGVLPLVSLPGEREMLDALAAVPGVAWDRLLFSAKESVYKAWFPRTGAWLGFEEAEITFDPAAGALSARLIVPGPEIGNERCTGFTGRFAARGGLIVTAVTSAHRGGVT